MAIGQLFFFCSEFNFKTCIVLNTTLQVHTRMLLHLNIPIFSSILSFFKVLVFILAFQMLNLQIRCPIKRIWKSPPSVRSILVLAFRTLLPHLILY